MKYIFASDPIENGGSPSPVPVIDTGLLRGVMMNQNQQLGFPRIITTNTSERPALARAPACCMLWSYEFCLVIRTYLSLLISTCQASILSYAVFFHSFQLLNNVNDIAD